MSGLRDPMDNGDVFEPSEKPTVPSAVRVEAARYHGGRGLWISDDPVFGVPGRSRASR